MSALKLLKDNVVVDAIKYPCYVVYEPRLGWFLMCPEAQAQGVAHRNGTSYWHLEGREEFGVDGYTTVSAVSISDEEADELIAALNEGEQPIEPDPEETPDTGEDTEPEQIISLTTVYAQLQTTQADVAALTAAIEKGLSL